MPKNHKDLLTSLNQCDRCGACTNVCPLYQVKAIDRATARGKIALAKAHVEGKRPKDNLALREAMDYCLLCGACTEVCPGKVSTSDAMIYLRGHFVNTHRAPLKYQLLAKVMGSSLLKSYLVPSIGLARHLPFKGLSKLIGPNLPTPNIKGPASKPLNPPNLARSVEHIKSIAYFEGCAMRLFFSEASQASLRLLRLTGRQVEMPKIDCCGLPAHAHGLKDKAIELARRNLQHLQAFDAIITDCGSCYGSLANYPQFFAPNDPYFALAENLAKRCWSLSEFLYAAGYQPKKRNLTTTYHDSCHLSRERGIKNAPRQLLSQASHYIEMDKANMCCGGAGSFAIDYPKESKAILNLKHQQICRSKAKIVVCECPSCLLQLGKLQGKHGLQVLHISQVI